MRFVKKYYLEDKELFKKQLLFWSENYEVSAFLESNCLSDNSKSGFMQNQYDCFLAVGVEDEIFSDGLNSLSCLQNFHDKNKDWLFGILSYDLKNEIEKLDSQNADNICFPHMHFFKARKLFIIKDKSVEILYSEDLGSDKARSDYKEISNTTINPDHFKERVDIQEIKSRFTKEEYIEIIRKLKGHIQFGDIYEINLCQEFYSENVKLSPLLAYLILREVSPTPFSSFYRLKTKYLISASPERFLKKSGKTIFSQPIKGTASRYANTELDKRQAENLRNDPKEISENVMIVDLVRNDLSRTSEKGSVKIEELFGIYSFAKVHQMISTVSSVLKKGTSFTDCIRYAFPMGSMTGAPKIRAMQLIEKYEQSKRGLYSGSIGYISPDGDFDFSVIIRSILYNAENQYLSFHVGGAITAESVPEKEYDECLIKAKAIRDTLDRLINS